MRVNLSLFGVLLLAAACRQKEVSPLPTAQRYEHGAYVLCEGNYGWGEGGIYYLDTSWKATEAVDAYQAANGFKAGNVVQSLTLSGDTAYLVVNNSNKVELLDAHTLKRRAANTTLTSPRYLLPVGARLLVTDLYANSLSVLNRATLATERTLAARGWTETLLRQGDRVYVANRRATAQASGTINEQLLVVQLPELRITDSLKLGGQGAQELVSLSDGRLVTALEKTTALSGAPGFAYVEPASGTVTAVPALPGKVQQPTRLQAFGGNLFWLQGDVLCWMPEAGGAVQSILPFGARSNLTSLRILTTAAGRVRLWVADARNYTSAGLLRELDLNPSDGIFTVRHEARVGIIPGQVVFF